MSDAQNDRNGTHWMGCWKDGGHRHYACAVAEAERQRARADQAGSTLALWQQAFGLLTTLAPDLEIDIRDPLDMARAIERHVLAERAALAAANARAEAAEGKLLLVDEYAEYCILCVNNSMFYDPFDVWFDEQDKVQP